MLLFAASHSKCIAILRARSWGSIALRRDRCTIVALCGIAAICTIYSKFKVQRAFFVQAECAFYAHVFLDYQYCLPNSIVATADILGFKT